MEVWQGSVWTETDAAYSPALSLFISHTYAQWQTAVCGLSSYSKKGSRTVCIHTAASWLSVAEMIGTVWFTLHVWDPIERALLTLKANTFLSGPREFQTHTRLLKYLLMVTLADRNITTVGLFHWCFWPRWLQTLCYQFKCGPSPVPSRLQWRHTTMANPLFSPQTSVCSTYVCAGDLVA